MKTEDIGHALLTDWASWVVTYGHKCPLWYPPVPFWRRVFGAGSTSPPVPTAGLAPRRVKAVQRAVNRLPVTTQAVVGYKYLLPGDDFGKWQELALSRRSWYRQIAEARRMIGEASDRATEL